MTEATIIDIHTHMFPGVDDGSTSMEETLRMAELAFSGGSRIVVLTPHFNPSDPDAMGFSSDRKMKEDLKRLKTLAGERNIGIRFAVGMEVFCTEDTMQALYDNRLVTLNHTKYLLVEFPFECDPKWVRSILIQLSNAGIIPVMAHPERYFFVQRNPQMIFDWTYSGCVMQCNRGSILGRFGQAVQETAFALLERDLVHCIASDAHRSDERVPYMADVYEFISDKFGAHHAKRLLFDNPLKILTGNPPELLNPKPFVMM